MRSVILLSLLLTSCGAANGFNKPTAAISGHVPTLESHALDASLEFPGNVEHAATLLLGHESLVTIPATLSILANSSQPGRATITFGSESQCYYYFSSGSTYSFFDCVAGYKPGNQLDMQAGETVVLTIDQGGFVSQNTTVEAIINLSY